MSIIEKKYGMNLYLGKKKIINLLNISLKEVSIMFFFWLFILAVVAVMFEK